jgi:hypothetical protein
MRPPKLNLIAVVGLVFGLAGAKPTHSAAQIPRYDGQWVADVPVQGTCPAAHMTLFVSGTSIIGNVANSAGTFPITGQIDASGKGTIKIVDFRGRIVFLKDHFAADYFNSCGERRAIGRKLVSGGKAAAQDGTARFAGPYLRQYVGQRARSLTRV